MAPGRRSYRGFFMRHAIHTCMLQLLTPPSDYVISLDELKTHLRIEHDTEDEYLETILETATEIAETHTNRAFMPQTWKLTLSHFCQRIELPKPPLMCVTEVEYLDTNEDTQTLAEDAYRVFTPYKQPGWIEIDSPPSTASRGDAVQITFVCGYGQCDEEDNSPNPPAMAKHLVKLIAGALYENRNAEQEQQTKLIEVGLDRLAGHLCWGNYQ